MRCNRLAGFGVVVNVGSGMPITALVVIRWWPITMQQWIFRTRKNVVKNVKKKL